jgi:hypothetical protein
VPLVAGPTVEAPVAVLLASHPLAQRTNLQMADLAGEPCTGSPPIQAQ